MSPLSSQRHSRTKGLPREARCTPLPLASHLNQIIHLTIYKTRSPRMTAKLRKSGVVRPSSLGGLSYSGVQFEGSLLKYDRAVYIKLSKLSTNGMMTRPARQRRMLVPRDLLPNDVSLSTSPSLSAVATLQEQGGEISISKISILYDNDAGGLSERVRDLFIGSPYAASGSSSGSSSRSSSPGRSTSRPSSFLSVEERSVSRPITPKRSPPPARMQTSSPGGTSLQAMTTPYSPASSISTVAANGNKYAQVPRESQPVARPQ